MIESLWFAFVAFLLIGYVVLDGFDLGAGILHFFVARSREEREQIIASIGPVWDGNEVWLVTAGGTLFLAFPKLYAISFSGFYLPLILILWLLAFRALGIELRHHVRDPLWQDFWDVAFSLASLVLAAAYGLALGNVVRGVTFDADGRFFAPFWTHFGVHDPVGIVDFYTVTIGLTTVASLALHGASWISLRTEGGVEARAVKAIKPLFIATIVMVIVATAVTLIVQPRVLDNLRDYPVGAIFPLLAVGSLVALALFVRRDRRGAAFGASSAFLTGMLGSAAFGIYPYVLPARTGEGLLLTEAAASRYALEVALLWWIPGMLLALVYVAILYRRISHKVSVGKVDP